jgi:hypothetical protein
MKIIPILIVMNGEERSDFALFQPIMTTKELTTYSQSAPMEAPRSALTPKSKCRLALILGGVCDDLAIETLAFSAR